MIGENFTASCLNPYYTGILYTRKTNNRRDENFKQCLNPYYTGILYTSKILVKNGTGTLCLNPYYTGILYTRYGTVFTCFTERSVLILIILEYYIREVKGRIFPSLAAES